MPLQPVKFRYINHRGETAERTVTPDAIEYISNPGYGYPAGWFLSGWDHVKLGRRSFALGSIVLDQARLSLPLRAEPVSDLRTRVFVNLAHMEWNPSKHIDFWTWSAEEIAVELAAYAEDLQDVDENMTPHVQAYLDQRQSTGSR